MAHSETFNLRVTPEERQQLRDMARRAARSESEFVRLVLRSIRPESVNPGIPAAALPEAKATERTTTAA